MAPLERLVLETQYGTSSKANDAGRGQPIIRMNNLTYEGNFDISDLKWVELADNEREKLVLHQGDLLFNRTNSRELVGKTGVWNGPEGYTFAGYLIRVRLRQDIVLPRWVAAFMNSPEGKKTLFNMAKPSINMANISASDLLRLYVPVAPIEHQKKTIAILDKADAIRRKRKQAIALTDQLLRSTFLEMFGDPVTNPKGFPNATLAEVATFRSGEFLPAREMDKDGIYPVYGGNGITGFHGKYMFQEPMVVVGRVGVYCGATHLTQENSWITDNALYVASMSPSLTKTYLYHALVNAKLNQYASQSAQPLISGSRLGRVPVLIPPVPVQQRFAEIALSHERLSQRQRQSEEHVAQLFGALVDRAFSGDLSQTEQVAGQLSMFNK